MGAGDLAECRAILDRYEQLAPHQDDRGVLHDLAESVYRLLPEVERLRAIEAAARELLGAFDPEWPGACPQECFDTSDGHGYERQEAAIRQARAALGGSRTNV